MTRDEEYAIKGTHINQNVSKMNTLLCMPFNPQEMSAIKINNKTAVDRPPRK
jgi:hypothetical protein